MKIQKSNSEISKVHVIFKTHLDIGFTDLAKNVVSQYIDSYIPKAIKLAEKLNESDSNAQFLWTTGSWLIYEYLKRANTEQKTMMEKAIDSGHIKWHGLPFTTHTELLDSNLLEYGLTIGKKLDKEFKRKTISAKMTDVPGHTKAMISKLSKHGIKYLHLGVNPASTVPSVPSIFLWRGNDDTELIVNYADTYGDVLSIDGLDEVMVFAHTGDNCGPPTQEEIEREFNAIQKQFPHAKVVASTMDAFAEKLLKHKDKLPILREEIGDSWIHGVGTDPKKVSQYRELLRLRNKWIDEGLFNINSEEYTEFSDSLLMIAEHTWGLDEKKFLGDYKNYSKQDFARARTNDKVTEDSVPDKYNYISLFAMNESDSNQKTNDGLWDQRSYGFFEKSWKEQREYIARAVKALSQEKQIQVKEAFKDLEPTPSCTSFAENLSIDEAYQLGNFTVSFSANGSIDYLMDQHNKQWATKNYQIGLVGYESFGVENYDKWFKEYVKNTDKHYRWSDADQGKPGIDLISPSPRYKEYSVKVISIKKKSIAEADAVELNLSFPEEASHLYGAPSSVIVTYTFYNNKNEIDVNLNWFDKDANRLPEALWMSFNPKVSNPNLWKMNKMDEQISPLHVVENGNRNLHAVNNGVSYDGAEGNVEIVTKDAPLLSWGEKRLLQFDNSFGAMDNGVHFNLFNNIWGTNFPMWYEDDAKFRFVIKVNSFK